MPLLEAFNPREVEPIHAVCLGKAGRPPAGVRAAFGVADAERSRDFHLKVLQRLGYHLTLTVPAEHAECGGEQTKAEGTL